jgi:hypothetical protein
MLAGLELGRRGSRALVGSNRRDVIAALAAAARPAAIAVTLERSSRSVQLPSLSPGCDCDLLLLSVLPSAETQVGRSENAGRSLTRYASTHRGSASQESLNWLIESAQLE